MAKETQSRWCKMPQIGAQCCAFAILFWLPLYLNNGYIRMIAAKSAFVYTAVCVCGIAVMIGVCISSCRLPAARLRTMGAAAVLLWCAVAAFGTITAHDRHTAIYGLRGRANGLLMLLACSAAFFMTALFIEKKAADFLLHSFVLGACIVSAVGWLNYFGCDILNVYSVVLPEQRHLFLSTLGNINFFGTFIVMASGVSLEKLIGAQKKRDVLWYAVSSVLLCSALIPANSDAAWLGLAVVCAVMLCRKTITGEAASRLFFVLALLCLCGVLTGMLISVLPVLAPLRTISAFLAKPISAAAGIFFLAASGMMQKKKNAVKLLRPVCISLLCAAILFVIIVNVFDLSLGAADSLLRFGPRWGSNRGYVWGRLLYVYGQELSPMQKLFGVGPDGVNALINPHYTEYIKAMNGTTFDSAHNEYLQCLMCNGIIGLLCSCTFWVDALRRAQKNTSAAAGALVGYCAASFFSINMPAVLAPAFVLAGLGYIPAETSRQTEPKKRRSALYQEHRSSGT